MSRRRSARKWCPWRNSPWFLEGISPPCTLRYIISKLFEHFCVRICCWRGHDGICMSLLISCCRVRVGLRGYGDHRGAPLGACGCRRKASFSRWARFSGLIPTVWLMTISMRKSRERLDNV
jgi:hypothetical protein